MNRERGFATLCVGYERNAKGPDKSGSISTPIYQTSTYAHPEVGQSTGYDYSRVHNPTREKLEKVVAGLEGGVDAVAFSSGMAAITALMEIFKPGDHIITDADLYGGSIRLFDHICEKNGMEFSHIDINTDDPEDFIRENTRAIYIETPTNPMMNIVDIRRMADIAHSHGLLLIVDNTFLSPYFQKPLSLGADIVVHSGTKFLGGHNDTLAGFVVCKGSDTAEKIRFIVKTIGSALAPFDSFLVLRGIKTLPLRMEKAQENAFSIVKYLQANPEVKKVYYPGLPGSRGYEVCKSQASGFGSMITFEVSSAGLARHILKSTQLIPFAESLGGTETLLTYPMTQTHADVPEEVRLKNGINDRVLRLSAGIEDVNDLIEDLSQAFESYGC